MIDNPRHDAADTAELIDGWEVYHDADTDQYVAAHPDIPLSSFGVSKEDAVASAEQALALAATNHKPFGELDHDAIFK